MALVGKVRFRVGLFLEVGTAGARTRARSSNEGRNERTQQSQMPFNSALVSPHKHTAIPISLQESLSVVLLTGDEVASIQCFPTGSRLDALVHVTSTLHQQQPSPQPHTATLVFGLSTANEDSFNGFSICQHVTSKIGFKPTLAALGLEIKYSKTKGDIQIFRLSLQ